jgi:RNA polymerase sigma-70 factor, ECF subfamily
MGLPVQTLARDVGGSVVEFPRRAGFEGEAPPDAEERDRLFAEMAERQARFMFRVAYGLLRSVQDAEDAVQEALLKLYRTDGWMRMEDEKAFLARTVWRVGLDVVARRSKSTEGLEDEAGREFADGGESAEQSLVGHGERELLRRLIEALPEELRQPLVLSAIEEMTSREVAIAMGIPEGTVRTRVMRARTELKRRFEAMRITTNGERR